MHDFEEQFGTEKQCLDYLFRLRWPDGYYCPRCYHNEAWQVKEWKYKCRKCGYQVTVLAGTMFQDTHLPITLWFKAIWYVCSNKGGTNALDFQKKLGLGSYRTAWTMLLKIRKLMADNEPARLGGKVVVDIYSAHRSDRAKNLWLLIAAEIHSDGTVGKICIDTAPNIYQENLVDFIKGHIKKGSTVVTERDPSVLRFIDRDRTYTQIPRQRYGKRVFLPEIYQVVKCLEENKLLGTQQLLSSRGRLHSYLAECCYKFNSRDKAVAEQLNEILYSAVRTDPLTYSEIVT